LVEIKNVGQCVIVLVKNVIATTMGDWFLQAQWATLYFPKSLMKGSKHGWLSYTPNWQTTNLLWKRYNFKLLSFIPSIHSINYVLEFSCLINESDFFFSGCWNIVYVESSNHSFSKTMCEMSCHRHCCFHNKWQQNDDVNCNVCHGKNTIKKARYLCASIAIIRDPIILTIEGQWLEVQCQFN
jgi:hypothetical protein